LRTRGTETGRSRSTSSLPPRVPHDDLGSSPAPASLRSLDPADDDLLAARTSAPGAGGVELADTLDEHLAWLVTIAVADLVRYRRAIETLVRREATRRVPSDHGEFTAVSFRSVTDGVEHVALVLGDVDQRGATGAAAEPVLARVHSECLTGDVFGSRRCDCGEQLAAALARIGEAGRGVVVYLRGHEGRGIGLSHKLRAYTLQDAGLDTVDGSMTADGMAPEKPAPRASRCVPGQYEYAPAMPAATARRGTAARGCDQRTRTPVSCSRRCRGASSSPPAA
jgi:GTP cyclohydrolase II